MAAWWQSLTLLEHILLYIAVPATLILVLQTVLLFAGGAFDSDGDADGGPEDLDGGPDGPDLGLDHGLPDDGLPDDVDAHGHPDGPDSGLHLFTVRGVVAFLVLFGWGGLWLCQIGVPGFLAVFLAIPIGFAGMVGIALAVRQAVRLQYDGTLNPRNALGLTGTVYLTVPAGRAATGKVELTVQEQLREFEAVTDSPDPIPTGEPVRVTGLAGRSTLVVEPAPASPKQQEKQD